MKTKSPKPTQASLARQLGVSRQLVSAHFKDPDAPKLDDVSGWAAFFAARGRSGSAPPELRAKLAQARLDILKEQKRRMARENSIGDKKMMLISDAQQQAAFACGYFFSELERAERELPPGLAGRSAVDIYKHLHGFIEALRRNAKAKFEEVGK